MASPSLIADIAVLLLPLLAGALCFAGAERMVRAPWAARVGLWLVWAGLAGTTIVYYADAGPTWNRVPLSCGKPWVLPSDGHSATEWPVFPRG